MPTIVSETNLITKVECDNCKNIMADKIDKLTNKIDHLKDDLSKEINEINITLAGFTQKLLDEADARYAKKEIEKNINWAVRIILGAVILALLALILKK